MLNFTKYNKLFLTLIIVAVLFMGIGYAKIGSIDLNINGQFLAQAPETVFISEATRIASSNADTTNSKIIECYDTMMNSKMVLSETEGTSSITYKITVFNNTNVDHYYNKVVYDSSTSFYSNSNITFKISGIARGDKLASGATTSFNIKFYYVDSTLPDTTISNYNILESYLNFVFTPEHELVDYNLNNSSALALKNSLTSGAISDFVTYSSGQFGDNFKIDGENGLYINDSSTSLNYFAIFSFLQEDGYSSALNPESVYYSRIENKLVTKGSDNNLFQFVLSNYFHNASIVRNGIQTYASNNNTVSSDYTLLSIWGKPKKHTDRTNSDGSVIWVGDYGDSIQIGSSVSNITESYSKNLFVMDLSKMFGINNEPSKEWCDNNIKFDTVTVKWFAEA